jgi:hypothetical protein
MDFEAASFIRPGRSTLIRYAQAGSAHHDSFESSALLRRAAVREAAGRWGSNPRGTCRCSPDRNPRAEKPQGQETGARERHFGRIVGSNASLLHLLEGGSVSKDAIGPGFSWLSRLVDSLFRHNIRAASSGQDPCDVRRWIHPPLRNEIPSPYRILARS